jgi:hypothetical protein
MPESFGKRQRRDVKNKKAVAREERRLARAQRKSDREAGLIEPGSPIQAADPDVVAPPNRYEEAEAAAAEAEAE